MRHLDFTLFALCIALASCAKDEDLAQCLDHSDCNLCERCENGACGPTLDDPRCVDAGVRDSGTPDSGADAEVDAGTNPTQLTVQVKSINMEPNNTAIELVSSATVALDFPTGGRVEQVTGVDGKTAFDIDWSGGGTAAVTAYAEGRMLSSWVNLTPEDDFVVLWMFSSEEAKDRVTVSGCPVPPQLPSHRLLVSTEYGYYQNQPSRYSVEVERNLPFTLVATVFNAQTSTTSTGYSQTFYGWRVIEHAGVSTSTTIDLDFTTSTPSFTASGSIQLPDRLDSPLRNADAVGAYVSSEDSVLRNNYGFATFIDLNAEGDALEYDMEWVKPPGALILRTFYNLIAGDTTSYVLALGLPTDVPHGIAFLDVPTVTHRSRRPFHAPVQFETYDEGPDIYVRLLINRRWTGELSWMVSSPTGFGSITMPPLPSTADTTEVLGTRSPEARVQVVEWDQNSTYVRRGAMSENFDIDLP